MSKFTTTYKLDGVPVDINSRETHHFISGVLTGVVALLEEIPRGLVSDEERKILDAIRHASGDLRAFHKAMEENLQRYDGNVETSLSEAKRHLIQAGKDLRKKR